MGVSLPGEGGGRGKSLAADLNLVPFIDLLSSLITFLLATAVWVQMSALDVEQAIRSPDQAPPEPDDKTPTPLLTVQIRSDGVAIFRGDISKGKDFPLAGKDYDWSSVASEMKLDRELLPDEKQVTIFTEDGVHYEHMIRALDLSRISGYEKTLLAGGPPKGK